MSWRYKIKRSWAIVIMITITFGAFFILYQPPPEDIGRSPSLSGELELINYNKSSNTLTYLVQLNESSANPSLVSHNTSYITAKIIAHNENITDVDWEYIDSDEDNMITTGDKVILYNATEYLNKNFRLRIQSDRYQGYIEGDIEIKESG
ncbi:MAG: hypothetical protein ACLFVL_06030 [Candidatus Aenigmatarchaeota archaeon]